MKLALYKTDYGSMIAFEVSDFLENADSNIRISEIVDVEFPPLPGDEVLNGEIAMIDTQIQKIKAGAQVTLNGLEQRKAELLALPDMSEQ